MRYSFGDEVIVQATKEHGNVTGIYNGLVTVYIEDSIGDNRVEEFNIDEIELLEAINWQ